MKNEFYKLIDYLKLADYPFIILITQIQFKFNKSSSEYYSTLSLCQALLILLFMTGHLYKISGLINFLFFFEHLKGL